MLESLVSPAPPARLPQELETIVVALVPRLGAAIGIAIVAGAIGGLAGGLVALQFDDEPPPAPTTVAAPAPAPTPGEGERLRLAIARVLPAVVTIVVDLPSLPQEGGGVLERQNFGSGIVVSTEGHVITNFHVVDGAETITIVLQNGERRPALILADDSPFSDLAILITDPTGLRAASLGDSDALELGEPLAAISSGLLTFDNQVKLGVFSARQAAFPRNGVLLLDMLQTDATLNNGDSGGALVNDSGQVIGLLTTVIRQLGGRPIDGIAMAHSSNSIKPIVEAVVATNVSPRARIGIERVDVQHVLLTPELIEEFRAASESFEELPVSDGALIVSVDPGSPADQAGVLPGDVVVGVDGVAIDANSPFVNLIAFAVVGVELDLFVVRGDERLVISVVPQLIAGVPS